MKKCLHIKFLFLAIALLFSIVSVNADPINKLQALQKAEAFFNRNNPNFKAKASIAYKAPKKVNGKTVEDEAYYYVFNKGINQGFVIVSGDDRCYPILGYTTKGNFIESKLPCNLKAFLQDYANQIKYIQDNNISPKTSLLDSNVLQQRRMFLIYAKPNGIKVILTITILAANYTGCVATAMSQVMYYWQWPQSATTTIPAYTVSGKTYSALDPVTFNWSKMQTTYSSGDYEDGHAVATLMEYVGHGVKMEYSTSGSGALRNGYYQCIEKLFWLYKSYEVALSQ
jgi:hypothetical protein